MSRIAKPGLDNTIIIAGHTIRRLAGTDGEYEGENKAAGTDFHIRDEGGEYILDIFNSRIKNRDAAHLESLQCESLHEAVTEAFRPEPYPTQFLVHLLDGHKAKPENVMHGFLANALNSKAIEVYDEEEARRKAEMFGGEVVPIRIQ